MVLKKISSEYLISTYLGGVDIIRKYIFDIELINRSFSNTSSVIPKIKKIN